MTKFDQAVESMFAVLVALIAARSLLETIHSDVPKSKRHALFNTKMADYDRAIAEGRRFLKVHGK